MKKIFRAIQHIHQFIHHPLTFMEAIHVQHGDLFSFKLGKKSVHFAYHPQHAEEILGTKSEHYQKSKLVFDKIKPITGKKGLVQLAHHEWEIMRKHTNEIFQRYYLENFIPVINTYADVIVKNIKSSTTPIDIQKIMIDYTMNIAIRMLFGIECEKTIKSISENFIALNDVCGKKMRSLFPIPFYIPTPKNLKILTLRKRLIRNFNTLIKQANHTKSNQNHLLAILQKAYPDKKYHSLIVDQLMTFLFAGFETTAASLSFCFFLLGKHPAIQQRIADEAKSINIHELDSLKKAHYTMACYREALRLYPPAWILAREATENTLLTNTQIKKGDVVILAIREIHRHPDFWRDATEFMPERFLDNTTRHKFSFIPFGYGKRICSGMQLAMLEATILLSKICSAFEIHSIEDHLSLEAMITLHPQNEVLIHATQRT